MLWLDAEAVRNFVMVADLQSFTRAADAMGSTQAAVSVKLKRLEERVGRKLIERTPRRVRLSADGALFIESARSFLAAHDKAVAGLSCSARRFTLGIAGHVAGPEVTTLLARLSQHDPALTIEVQVDNSTLLLDAFDRGELDATIVRREDDRRDGEVLGPEHFGWYATPEFDHRQGEPIRLATLSRLCGVRDLAIRTLDDAGIAWVEVFVGGGSSLVTAAVSAGLATAVFPSRLAPPGTVEVSRKFGLPDVPATEIVLHSSLTDRRSREALRILACAFHEHRAKAG